MLRPYLQSVELSTGDVLAEVGGKIDRVYFPHGGIVSIIVSLAEGEMVEVAMIGREGAVGVSVIAAADDVALNTAIVRLPGSASMLGAEQLRNAAERSALLRILLGRHQRALFAQAQQAAACNACHGVELRLSRCLLQMRELSGRDAYFITQEALSQMLGVRRNSVSAVAHALQQANLIRYSRGHIQIVDPEGLRKGACECYATVKAHRDRLLGGPAEPTARLR